MFIFILSLGLTITLIVNIYFAVKDFISFLKNGEYVKAIILGVIFAIGILCDCTSLKLFGFTYNFIIAKLVFIGLFSLIFTVFNMHCARLVVTFLISTWVVLVMYLFMGPKIPNMIYSEMPHKVEEHFVQKEIKNEAMKLDAKKELEVVLKNIGDKEITAETVNSEIRKLGYEYYNGIYCYDVKDEGDVWHVGMAYGDIERSFSTFKGEKFTTTENFYVSKVTRKIVSR